MLMIPMHHYCCPAVSSYYPEFFYYYFDHHLAVWYDWKWIVLCFCLYWDSAWYTRGCCWIIFISWFCSTTLFPHTIAMCHSACTDAPSCNCSFSRWSFFIVGLTACLLFLLLPVCLKRVVGFFKKSDLENVSKWANSMEELVQYLSKFEISLNWV